MPQKKTPCSKCGNLKSYISKYCWKCAMPYKRTKAHRIKMSKALFASPLVTNRIAKTRMGARGKTRRMYPLTNCELCGKKATERHHIDNNTFNNEHSNIIILCRRCHMKLDGRLKEFISHRIIIPIKPLMPCKTCGRLYKPLRKGECGACYVYRKTTGKTSTPEVRKKSRKEYS